MIIIKSLRLFVCAIVVTLSCIGCSGRQVRITPIQQTDFFPLAEGETFTAPKAGYFASDEVVDEIFDAKVN